jgi:hypothetical protein
MVRSTIGDGTFNGTLIPPARDKNGHWLRGTSGNTGGRPAALKHVVELSRSYTSDAIRVLGEIVNDSEQPSACRIVACNSLLDRGWGRPVPADHMVVDGDRSLPR